MTRAPSNEVDPFERADVQYRLHATIGELVSRLYYEGALKSAPGVNERQSIAAHEPFDGNSSRGRFSNARNLLNVSVSRARGKLILIADVHYFEDQAPEGPLTKLLQVAATLGRRVAWNRG